MRSIWKVNFEFQFDKYSICLQWFRLVSANQTSHSFNPLYLKTYGQQKIVTVKIKTFENVPVFLVNLSLLLF